MEFNQLTINRFKKEHSKWSNKKISDGEIVELLERLLRLMIPIYKNNKYGRR